MNLRLKTTHDTEEKLGALQNWLHLSSKAAVMRLGISWSLKNSKKTELIKEHIVYDIKEKDGSDYIRMTIFGGDEEFYWLLMANSMQRDIAEDEFFPTLTSYHIERGVSMLFSEYRYLNDKDKYIKKLLGL